MANIIHTARGDGYTVSLCRSCQTSWLSVHGPVAVRMASAHIRLVHGGEGQEWLNIGATREGAA